jgi:5-methylcytosine-specific restriction endonuclease McrA
VFHKIKFPSCVNQLERIVLFQRKLLNFACNSSTSLPITENQLKAEFGDEIGEWLWDKFWTKRKSGKKVQSKLHKALEKLIKYIERHSTMSAKIMDAFDHDIQFHQHLNDPNFKFKYRGELSLTVQKVVKGLLTAFYTDLLSSGFPSFIHGQTQKFDRDKFISSFWLANSKLAVCPACDGRRSPKIENKVYSDADHFFPKSTYPFLSVHYANLVPLCLDCNRSIKGDRDPIDDLNQEPLVNTFHPYANPAISQVDVIVSRNQFGKRQVKIEDKAGMPSRRVASLNRVFKLEKQWLDHLDYVVNSIVEAVREDRRKLTRRGLTLTLEDLKYDLEDKLKENIAKLGEKHYYVMQCSYLRYTLTNNQELTELLAESTN